MEASPNLVESIQQYKRFIETKLQPRLEELCRVKVQYGLLVGAFGLGPRAYGYTLTLTLILTIVQWERLSNPVC